MLKPIAYLSLLAVPVLLSGCAGPERKLGRGINNLTEFTRFGEISRSVEQTTLWEGGAKGRTTGFIRGFNRSMARTFIGAAEVATFYAPWPKDGDWSYDACYTPDGPLYPDYSMATYNEDWGGMRLPEYGGAPDSFSPGWTAQSGMDTDGEMGITGGSIIAPYPLGKFRINEQ